MELYLSEVDQYAKSSVKPVLVANKCDLESERVVVTRKEGAALAEKHGLPFFEVSAKTGQNVEALFYHVVEACIFRWYFSLLKKSGLCFRLPEGEDVVRRSVNVLTQPQYRYEEEDPDGVGLFQLPCSAVEEVGRCVFVLRCLKCIVIGHPGSSQRERGLETTKGLPTLLSSLSKSVCRMDLCGCDFSEDVDDVLDSIPRHLQSLQISACTLWALSAAIVSFTKLQKLDVHGNQLTALPDSIGQLTQLKSLLVHENQLASLPDSICELVELEELSLHSNKLASLPERVGSLQRLPSLDVHGNQLTALPDSIGQLTQLKSLLVHENQLASLPDSICELVELEALSLHSNKLGSLPERVGSLQRLPSLDVHGNQLTALPDSIGQLTQLKSLLLHENNLPVLPTPLFNLQELQRLELHSNLLCSVPDGAFRHLRRLRYLSIQRNALERGEENRIGSELAIAALRSGQALPDVAGGDRISSAMRRTYREYHAFGDYGFVPVQHCRVAVCGHWGSGKSELLRSLRRKRRWLPSGKPDLRPKTRTRGAALHTFKMQGGDGPVFVNALDLGGQRTYRAFQSFLLRGDAPAVFVVACDVGDVPKLWAEKQRQKETRGNLNDCVTKAAPPVGFFAEW